MFIYPCFVVPGKKVISPIAAMPGICRFSPDELVREAEKGMKLGINKILIFGTGEKKTRGAQASYSHGSVAATAIKSLKKYFGNELYIISDICLCAYTDHGHCGIVEHGIVHNDKSVDILAKMALSHARSGVDMVAPSDMMDGRVRAIRNILDNNGFENIPVMSYAAKFASAYYGPFREAASSAPQHGDRKTYQMDFRNGREAVKEALADEYEGADILMVKPALAYLDVIARLRRESLLPVACYNVSGEYSMVKAAARQGLVDERSIVMENMYAFARAGADIIISYHVKDLLEKKWL